MMCSKVIYILPNRADRWLLTHNRLTSYYSPVINLLTGYFCTACFIAGFVRCADAKIYRDNITLILSLKIKYAYRLEGIGLDVSSEQA
jgi:hypothetical protein